MVAGDRPSARSSATYCSSRSVVTFPTGPSSQAARAVRSRRYASTVFGARRVASSARKPSTSGSGMRSVVDTTQPPCVHVAVDLCGGERAMSQELLDGAHVGAAFEEMRCKRVTEAVRMGEDPAQGRRIESTPARRDEHGVLCATYQRRPRLVQVAREHVRCFLAERNDPFLSALSSNVELLPFEVDIREV